MRDAIDARITLEVAIVRLTHPEADDDASALLERIERLERRIQSLATPVGAAPPPPPPPPPPPGPAPRPAPAADRTSQPSAPLPQAQPEPGSQPALGAFGDARPGPGPLASSRSLPIPPPVPVTEGPVAEPTLRAVPPPTRDELVAAWGDHVLSQLRPGFAPCSRWAGSSPAKMGQRFSHCRTPPTSSARASTARRWRKHSAGTSAVPSSCGSLPRPVSGRRHRHRVDTGHRNQAAVCTSRRRHRPASRVKLPVPLRGASRPARPVLLVCEAELRLLPAWWPATAPKAPMTR